MKKILLALFLFTPAAFAQMTCPPPNPVPKDAALLCWTNATQDVNGNTLPLYPAPGSITTTRVHHINMSPASKMCDFADGVIQTVNKTPADGSHFFNALPPGRHCFRVRHISTIDGKDIYSDWSSVLYKIIVPFVLGKALPPSTSIDAGATDAEAAAYDDGYDDSEDDDPTD